MAMLGTQFTSTQSSKSCSKRRTKGIRFASIFLSCVLLSFFYSRTIKQYVSYPNSHATVLGSGTKFKGSQFWKKGSTLEVRTLYETAFARAQVHKVQLEDGSTVVNDWLWFDELDHINVLVEKSGKPSLFVVFKQMKYAIEGESLALVGGMIESGETALQAAVRELREELNMEADRWVDLGSYRPAANRGGGMTFTFMARGAKNISGEGISNKFELEKQDIVYLTREKLLEAVLAGEFKEIKWTATVALALLKFPASTES